MKPILSKSEYCLWVVELFIVDDMHDKIIIIFKINTGGTDMMILAKQSNLIIISGYTVTTICHLTINKKFNNQNAGETQTHVYTSKSDIRISYINK